MDYRFKNKTNYKGMLIFIIVFIIPINFLLQSYYFSFESFREYELINAIVKQKRVHRGTSYLKILDIETNELKKVAIANSINSSIKNENFCDFIRKGDRIIKELNSHYIIVCRNGKGYKFKVGDLYYSKKPFNCN